MVRRLALALVVLMAATGCGRASQPEAPPAPPFRLRAHVDRVTGSIYDPITLTVRADYAEGIAPRLPDAPPVPEGMTLDDAQEAGPFSEAGRQMLERTYTMHAEHPGSYIIPSVSVAYTLPDGTEGEARTARMFVTIASLLADGDTGLEALRPPKPPVPLPRDYTGIWKVMAWVAAGTLLGAVLLALWLRRRQEGGSLAPEPPGPPHETALLALATLERSPLLSQGRVREYVYELSEIFCEYLEGRFGIPAIASTSEQLLEAVEHAAGLPGDATVLVKHFVRDTDPIKFSNAPGETAVAERWTREIRSFVERTRPEPALEVAA